MVKQVSGSLEFVMQSLADQITKLRQDMTDLQYQVLGQQHAINILLTGLRDADEEAYVRTMGRLESVRDAQLKLSEQEQDGIDEADQPRAKRAFKTISGQLTAILEFAASPQPPGITLTVIPGGQEDS